MKQYIAANQSPPIYNYKCKLTEGERGQNVNIITTFSPERWLISMISSLLSIQGLTRPESRYQRLQKHQTNSCSNLKLAHNKLKGSHINYAITGILVDLYITICYTEQQSPTHIILNGVGQSPELTLHCRSGHLLQRTEIDPVFKQHHFLTISPSKGRGQKKSIGNPHQKNSIL